MGICFKNLFHINGAFKGGKQSKVLKRSMTPPLLRRCHPLQQLFGKKEASMTLSTMFSFINGSHVGASESACSAHSRKVSGGTDTDSIRKNARQNLTSDLIFASSWKQSLT